MVYRVYTADACYLLTHCLAGESGLSMRYYDILHPTAQTEVDGDAIAADIIGRIASKGGET